MNAILGTKGFKVTLTGVLPPGMPTDQQSVTVMVMNGLSMSAALGSLSKDVTVEVIDLGGPTDSPLSIA